MARYWKVSLFCCLVAVLHWQVSAGVDGAVTDHGLVLPSSMPEEHVLLDDAELMQDTWIDEEYIMELEKQEMEEMQQMLGEQEYLTKQQQAENPATPISKPTTASTTIKRLQLPLELSTSAQPGASVASTLSKEIRSAVDQARDIAAQLMKNQGVMKILSGGAGIPQQEEAAPVNVIELAQAANLAGGADGGVQIDVTVTTERSGPTWMLPSLFPNSMPSMFGMFGQEASSGNEREAQLAAEIAQTVIESALANQVAAGDQELVLDMTVENASPQKTQQLVAAAAAAAVSAAASSAMNSQQPWDTLELQLDVVETTVPFFKSPRFFVAAMLLLTVQLLLCFAVAVLWANSEEEEEEEGSESEDDTMCYKVITDCDLKKQKLQQQEHRQQGEWASLAEEGRGLYEKLLSYT